MAESGPARALMFQGTGSDVGKSLVVAGLARAFTLRGLKILPFKPQNMSNNAAVTADGGEIGRAQALQARAAKAPLSVHMNPVLLKPQSEVGAQVVVQGKVEGNARAAEYQLLKPKLMPRVLESFELLRAQADLVLVEGAGSASEINLRQNDIANMGFARAADVPVVLIGDIDRGGVIASLAGTRLVLDPEDAAMIRAFIVNRFRGDPALFADGMRMIAERTGWQSIGLLPHFADAARLPAEDALGLNSPSVRKPGAKIRIAVPILPHISNFDDLDPLEAEPDVDLVRVRPGHALPGDCDLVLLVGSKATISDLVVLKAAGFDIDIAAHVRRGGHVLGLCGGYQMLGKRISDPDGIEGPSGSVEGLGLLDIETMLSGDKRLEAVTGVTFDGVSLSGYEMHVGRTAGPDCERTFSVIGGTADGARSADGRIFGTYLHGLFSDDRQRSAWLKRLGASGSALNYEAGCRRGAGSACRAYGNPSRSRRAAYACEKIIARMPKSAISRISAARASFRAWRMSSAFRSVLPFSHIGGVDHLSAIAARTGEPDAQSPGHRGFRPSGIGRTMMAGVAADGLDGISGRGILDEKSREDEEGCRKARSGKVDQVVETRRRPAESQIPRQLVANHAVSGVGRLVGRAARQAADAHPEGRRDDPVRKVFRQAFNCSAGDRRPVEVFDVATDDLRNRLAARDSAALAQREGHVVDVFFKALLGRKHCGDDQQQQWPQRKLEKAVLQDNRDCDDDAEKGEKCADAHLPADREIVLLAVPFSIQPRNELAHPGDGMADQTIDKVRIADEAFDEQSQKCEKKHACETV